MNLRHLAAARRHRVIAASATGLLALLLAWSPVLAAVSWGDLHRASPEHVYTWGNSLGRTVTSGGTAYLHQIWEQYVIGGEEVSDAGPYLGVYYRRGSSGAGSWSQLKRLNASTTHAEYSVLATSGKYVYGAWRTQPHSNSTWNGVDPRPLQFRRNTNHGNADYWKSKPSFLGADRIDRPSIAATGSRVYIAYTDAIGGEIRLQKSTDYGATFSYKGAIGATTALWDGGYGGRPVIVATGSTVAVVWDNGSSSRIKISLDGGSTWTVDTDFDPSRLDRVDGAASAGRVAFVWVGGGGSIHLRRFNGTTLGPKRTVEEFNSSTTYKEANSPAIAMSGASVIGIAYTACSDDSCGDGPTMGKSIRWTESRDSGAHWSPSVNVGYWGSSTSRRNNEWPSAIFAGSSKRIVSWTSFGSAADAPERILVRVGTGTP